MTTREERLASIAATRAIKTQACPRCGKGTCSCYSSGEFFDLQRQVRELEAALIKTTRERDAALSSQGALGRVVGALQRTAGIVMQRGHHHYWLCKLCGASGFGKPPGFKSVEHAPDCVLNDAACVAAMESAGGSE